MKKRKNCNLYIKTKYVPKNLFSNENFNSISIYLFSWLLAVDSLLLSV